jgi:nitrilase
VPPGEAGSLGLVDDLDQIRTRAGLGRPVLVGLGALAPVALQAGVEQPWAWRALSQPMDTPYGRLSGLTCWENYMPLARFYLYAQGVDIWTAPTLAVGDGWVATMRHIAREGRCYVIGANPCVHIDQIPADFPRREHVWRVEQDDGQWVELGNSVIIDPNGELLAGPARHQETILTADIDLAAVRAARRMFDPVGHYHRPDIFRLTVDTRPRPPYIIDET